MTPFLKDNNEKLMFVIVLILAIIIFFTSLAGATGDKIPSPDKQEKELKADIMAFNQAVEQLEASMNTEEDLIYEVQQKVRFYDADFNLIYETTQQEVAERTDCEALNLLRKSTLFMEQKEGDIYMLL